MSGEDIAAEVAAALREASAEVGSGAPLIATLTQPGGNQQNPWDPPSTGLTHEVAVLVMAFDVRQVDGTLIQAQDRKVLVEANGVAPTPSDTLTIEGVVYNIIRATPLNPGGVALMHEVQARKQ